MRWSDPVTVFNLTVKDYDVELLMLHLQRSVNPEYLVGDEIVIRFKFTDIKDFPDWWMFVQGNEVELCVNDPGKEVDIYFTTTVKTMVDVWIGWSCYRRAIAQDELKLVGPKALINNVSAWMEDSIFAEAEPTSSI